MTALPEVIHFQKWIDDHAQLLKPPVKTDFLKPTR